MKLYFALVIVALTVGCSNRAVYDNVQINKRNECMSLQKNQYDECMKSVNKSYDEYEKERKEVLEK